MGEQVKLKMLQLKRQLTSLTIEANAYEDVLFRTSNEAERISKVIDEYQKNSSTGEEGSTGDDSSEYDYSSKYPAASSRMKRASRMKGRRNSVHEIKIC